MAWIRHESGEQTVIKNRQALGPESPLETDGDGYAEVEDDDAAELLATLDAHVEVADAPEDDEGATCQTEKSDGEICGRELPCPYHSDGD